MRGLLLLMLFGFLSISFAQIPETEDSVYWSGNYCDTAETIEEALTQWIWSSDINDCMQPNLEDIENLWIALWLSDEYECCCRIASLPGSNAAMSGFWDSPCKEYLDSIDFNYMTLDENRTNKLDGIYIDMYGRRHMTQPKGLSIMNKEKYYKL